MKDSLAKENYKEGGITLIALVITIIVLLILAGISIATLTGESGILNKANVAKEETVKLQVLEELRLKVLEIQIEKKGTANLQDVVDYLKSDTENKYVFSLTSDFEDSETFPDIIETTEIYVIYKDFKFKIDSNLVVTLIGEKENTTLSPEKQLEKDSLVLLEHFDGNHEVIINSDKITTQEKKVGNSSLYLNDTAVEDNFTKQFGFTNDFTIEYWIKLGNENLNYEYSIQLAVYANNGIYLAINNGKYVVRGWGVQNYLTVDPPPVDEWVHIAVSRKSGILRVFYNGILQGSVENSTNFTNGRLCIGYDGEMTYCKNSYIDEVKISPNIGKYESNFDVNNCTTNLDDIIYHFENDDEIDESFAARSINEKKFGKSSYYFDNSYIRYKEREDFQLSSDFTIDYWIKQSTESLNGPYPAHLVVAANNGIYLGFADEEYKVRGWNVQDYLKVDLPPVNEWVHIAVTRKDGILRVFYNGILQGQTENTTIFSKGDLWIGSEGSGYFIRDMYMDELRILNGYCQWTENFTVPSKSYEY